MIIAIDDLSTPCNGFSILIVTTTSGVIYAFQLHVMDSADSKVKAVKRSKNSFQLHVMDSQWSFLREEAIERLKTFNSM